jgi:hypothetical protein
MPYSGLMPSMEALQQAVREPLTTPRVTAKGSPFTSLNGPEKSITNGSWQKSWLSKASDGPSHQVKFLAREARGPVDAPRSAAASSWAFQFGLPRSGRSVSRCGWFRTARSLASE